MQLHKLTCSVFRGELCWLDSLGINVLFRIDLFLSPCFVPSGVFIVIYLILVLPCDSFNVFYVSRTALCVCYEVVISRGQHKTPAGQVEYYSSKEKRKNLGQQDRSYMTSCVHPSVMVQTLLPADSGHCTFRLFTIHTEARETLICFPGFVLYIHLFRVYTSFVFPLSNSGWSLTSL